MIRCDVMCWEECRKSWTVLVVVKRSDKVSDVIEIIITTVCHIHSYRDDCYFYFDVTVPMAAVSITVINTSLTVSVTAAPVTSCTLIPTRCLLCGVMKGDITD